MLCVNHICCNLPSPWSKMAVWLASLDVFGRLAGWPAMAIGDDHRRLMPVPDAELLPRVTDDPFDMGVLKIQLVGDITAGLPVQHQGENRDLLIVHAVS